MNPEQRYNECWRLKQLKTFNPDKLSSTIKFNF